MGEKKCDIYVMKLFFFKIFIQLRSAAAISVKDSNGTFISTLNLLLYNVSEYKPTIATAVSLGNCVVAL